MATAIKVENLSKIYRLGEIGTGTISKDIERFVKTKILKQEDSFLKIGETNDRSTKGTSDIVYSLKDINFEIKQGDAIGIIGRNGAGKSTLLKILSRVTSPTTGKINIKGRVASLLEVGTGFHPELTGRENIYLNGTILGIRKREIDRKLDEIIDFSGVERYIDTPVKRYSSGMYARLAFAVAAHLESEILIIDEVLAVGDAEFQQKCLGKMDNVSRGEGRTVLFVTHNMASIEKLCNYSILLDKGGVKMKDVTKNVLDFYQINLNADIQNKSKYIHKLTIKNRPCNTGEYAFYINTIISTLNLAGEVIYGFKIYKEGNQLITCYSDYYSKPYILNKQIKQLEINFSSKGLYLVSGGYLLDFEFYVSGKLIDNLEIYFHVDQNTPFGNAHQHFNSQGPILIDGVWS